MTRPGPTLRMFVAAYPPLEVARSLGRALDALDAPGMPDHRRTPEEQVHLTLHFIGDVLARDVERTTDSVERSAHGLPATVLRPLRLVALPDRGRARMVVAETDAPPTLLEIHRRLVSRLARRPRRDSARRFLPHLTLCRFTAPARIDRIETTLDEAAFPFTEIRLMRSTLAPGGARHDTIATIALRDALRPSP